MGAEGELGCLRNPARLPENRRGRAGGPRECNERTPVGGWRGLSRQRTLGARRQQGRTRARGPEGAVKRGDVRLIEIKKWPDLDLRNRHGGGSAASPETSEIALGREKKHLGWLRVAVCRLRRQRQRAWSPTPEGNEAKGRPRGEQWRWNLDSGALLMTRRGFRSISVSVVNEAFMPCWVGTVFHIY